MIVNTIETANGNQIVAMNTSVLDGSKGIFGYFDMDFNPIRSCDSTEWIWATETWGKPVVSKSFPNSSVRKLREKSISNLLYWIETDHEGYLACIDSDPNWDGDLWDCNLLHELSKWGLPYNDNTPYAELKQLVKSLA